MPTIQEMYADFYNETRLHQIKLPVMTKPTNGGLTSQVLPRTGLLQGIHLIISITISGTLSNLNTLGVCSAIRRIRLLANSASDIVSISGAGLVYLLNEQIGTELALAQGTTLNQGGSAVSAATFKLNAYLPVAMNRRDTIGLFLLQSEQQTVELSIDWEADTTVATGATITGTCTPILDILTVPAKESAMPSLNLVHQIIEDSYTVSGSGDVTYEPLRGQVYLSIWHGLTLLQSAADAFTRFRVVVGGSDVWRDVVVADLDMMYYLNRGRVRRAGVIDQDYMVTSELGTLGLSRDWFDTRAASAYQHIITASTSGTLTTLRRQLVRVA